LDGEATTEERVFGSVSGVVAAIMVLTAGSTGDVEPFAALAELLGRRGHTVTLTADAGFERLAPNAPVEFRPIRADFRVWSRLGDATYETRHTICSS